MLQVPLVGYRAAPPSPAAAMLYTGEDQTVSTALAKNLFVQNALSPAAIAAPIANFQSQAAQVTCALQSKSVLVAPDSADVCSAGFGLGCCLSQPHPPLPQHFCQPLRHPPSLVVGDFPAMWCDRVATICHLMHVTNTVPTCHLTYSAL